METFSSGASGPAPNNRRARAERIVHRARTAEPVGPTAPPRPDRSANEAVRPGASIDPHAVAKRVYELWRRELLAERDRRPGRRE